MDIYIKQMVIHILDNTIGMPMLSQEMHPLNAEANDFVAKHVEKLFKSMKRKDFVLNENSVVKDAVLAINQDKDQFLQQSKVIANRLYNIMMQHLEIPSADLVVAEAIIGDTPYLVALKLNYNSKFSHYIKSNEDMQSLSVVQTKTLQDTTLHEAFAVRLKSDKMDCIVLEKLVNLEDEKGFYISTLLLRCKHDVSPQEKLKLVERRAKIIIDRYYGDDEVEKLVEFKNAINDQLEENEVTTEDLADVVFGHVPQIRDTFLQELDGMGIDRLFEVNKQDKNNYYKHQEVITDAGFEIKMPVGLANNKEHIEFIVNEQGRTDIVIKNISSVKRK